MVAQAHHTANIYLIRQLPLAVQRQLIAIELQTALRYIGVGAAIAKGCA